jgi:hypothetical protein
MGWTGEISFVLAYESALVDLDSSVDTYMIPGGPIRRQLLTFSNSRDRYGDTQIRLATWGPAWASVRVDDDSKNLHFWAEAARITDLKIEPTPLDGDIHTCLLVSQSEGIVCGRLLGIEHTAVGQFDHRDLKLVALSRSKFRNNLLAEDRSDYVPTWGCVNILLIQEQKDQHDYSFHTCVAVGVIRRNGWKALHPTEEHISLN